LSLGEITSNLDLFFSQFKNKKTKHMVQLIGSNYNEQTGAFTFFFHNTDTNWYYEMSCRNSFGTKDMNSRTPEMSREEFVEIAGDRLA
jgi:hypothetical protein